MEFQLKFSSNSINFFNKTALHYACENGNAKIAKLLLLHPEIDVNIRSISTIIFFNVIPHHFLIEFYVTFLFISF